MPAPGQDHSGDYGGRVPPVPIPNTEVKPPCAYGTAGLPGGRVGRRRNDRGLATKKLRALEEMQFLTASDGYPAPWTKYLPILFE